MSSPLRSMLEMEEKVLLQHVGHLLRYVWDPLRLDLDGPADEYDAYAPAIAALVRDTKVPEAEITASLVRIEIEALGLPAASGRTTRATRALLGLREAVHRAPDRLVAQRVSQDGLRCLWVFRRHDGFCNYEQAALVYESDENGTWSWWAAAGEGRSGLFASAEAATQDARAAIDWLR